MLASDTQTQSSSSAVAAKSAIGQASVSTGSAVAARRVSGQASVSTGSAVAARRVSGQASVSTGSAVAAKSVSGQASVSTGSAVAARSVSGQASVSTGSAVAEKSVSGQASVSTGSAVAAKSVSGQASVSTGNHTVPTLTTFITMKSARMLKNPGVTSTTSLKSRFASSLTKKGGVLRVFESDPPILDLVIWSFSCFPLDRTQQSEHPAANTYRMMNGLRVSESIFRDLVEVLPVTDCPSAWCFDCRRT